MSSKPPHPPAAPPLAAPAALGQNHAWLHTLLYEANFEGKESVSAAYQRIMGRQAGEAGVAEAIECLQHIINNKQACWRSIDAAVQQGGPQQTTLQPLRPPSHLPELLRWELTALSALAEAKADWAMPLQHKALGYTASQNGSQRLSLAALLRLNARHSVWRAGQVALLLPKP